MTDEAEWLATLRPSRIREVQAGALSWATVNLLDVESGNAAGLRGVLERFGIGVTMHTIGQARQFVAAVSGSVAADYVLVAGHGGDSRFLLPELAAEVERYQPFHDGVGPDQLRSFAHFHGAVVIATGCETGHPDLARAVLDCGASAYIAPTGAPFGYASLFAPLFLFYELTERRSLADAVARLRAHDSELAMWTLYA